MQHTVLITGAAGYVGTMLVERFAKRSDVVRIIGLDKEPLPDLIKDEPKLTYIESNTADDWEEQVRKLAPDIVIHTAWQIRELYGNRPLTWKWNIEGSDKVFSFAYEGASVKRLIHFSTVASYGAFPSNTIEHRFTEDEPFRKTDYLYAEEKRITEEHLEELFAKAKQEGKEVPTTIVRPAAITGPRGRFMRIRFGLQAALAGQLKDSFVYRLVSTMTRFVPVTPRWVRQFIHEDDVVNLIELLAFSEPKGSYEIFNICPPGEVVRGKDMALAVGKKTLLIQPWMARLPFAFLWHATRGKIPTAKGSWKGYSYPIAVDGSKLTRVYGYEYQYASLDAFRYTDGVYESFVPVEARNPKP
ncbi:NAD-dependent epimerase/dehydratase family protein [Patescibacteria group bacterium]|nr:NAD-dependent epimerase/dehydratase family protein [Patescibacteria group bacterium]MBU1500705.1 NAD-dependent epimerase/dehydratase family protein [Patescibacteria group bacterium]MBU2080977.1 NAD-dependent epimerase/dehydratase family protein [Patescibacteria group bacterium]MBU2124245.1 NAD-dependent epimerase/dehydratase family protein [Patescibacteria group bacterium]MBU2195038.1 NAD-dependent epimerase/dehydratase family protein [Patescibacteria group bacterium]